MLLNVYMEYNDNGVIQLVIFNKSGALKKTKLIKYIESH